MPGNERLVVKYIIEHKNSLKLNHIGVINKIQNPSSDGRLIDISTVDSLRTEDSSKKADIYLNKKGVSIKQSGSSFLYNRLQRSEMLRVFQMLGFSNPASILKKMDDLINQFHNGHFESRDRHWSEAFDKDEFVQLLEYLMMKGSPNLGTSSHPAEFILTAPGANISASTIFVETFCEYFKKYSDVIYISLRRQWIGQLSNSEHQRALSLARKQGNAPWVYTNIVGSPRTGWRNNTEFPISNRRTVYMTFITVKP